MSAIVTTMINEAQTPDDYRQACMVVQQHIRSGQASFDDLQHLAIKGHVIAATYGEALVSPAFIQTYSTDPTPSETLEASTT